MGGETIRYIEFGGMMIPADMRRTTVTDEESGQILYCVFPDYDGTKIVYPEQKPAKSQGVAYAKMGTSTSFWTHSYESYQRNISKNVFENYWEKARDKENGYKNIDTKSFYYTNGRDMKEYRQINTSRNAADYTVYMEYPIDNTPLIEYSTEGFLTSTKKVKIYNAQDLKYTGSNDEDDVTAENCTNCTFDVADENNNLLFSDKVKIVNGSENLIKAGSFDKSIFTTYNYTTATEQIQQSHRKEGDYKQ